MKKETCYLFNNQEGVGGTYDPVTCLISNPLISPAG